MENNNARPEQPATPDRIITKEDVLQLTENVVDEALTIEEEYTKTKTKPCSRMPARATSKTGFSKLY